MTPADDQSRWYSGDECFELDECTPTVVIGPDGRRYLGLDCEIGGLRFGLELREFDEFAFAGILLGTLDELARERGLDAIEARGYVRRTRERIRDNLAKVEALTCSKCSRPTAVIDSGVRYCKRHAREAGVLVHGKIGE